MFIGYFAIVFKYFGIIYIVQRGKETEQNINPSKNERQIKSIEEAQQEIVDHLKNIKTEEQIRFKVAEDYAEQEYLIGCPATENRNWNLGHIENLIDLRKGKSGFRLYSREWDKISKVALNYWLAIEKYADTDNPQLEFGKGLKDIVTLKRQELPKLKQQSQTPQQK